MKSSSKAIYGVLFLAVISYKLFLVQFTWELPVSCIFLEQVWMRLMIKFSSQMMFAQFNAHHFMAEVELPIIKKTIILSLF